MSTQKQNMETTDRQMSNFSFTNEQQEIINSVKEMCANEILKINAFAGTGKTSTLIAIAEALPHKRFLYIAFNNSIVEESKKKFPKNVTILTTHSLAYRRVVAPLGASIHVGNYLPIEVASWYNIDNQTAYEGLQVFDNFLASDKRTLNRKQSVPHDIAYKIYLDMLNGQRDMTHSFYLKQYQLISDKGLPSYDYVMLDEGQDTNDVTLDIFMNIDAAKIIVGDTHQSIYTWRGANNAMEKVEADFNLFLTQTFRCKQQIVDRANFILKNFKGETVQIISACNANLTDESYAVITRTNAKMIENFAEFDDDYKIIKHPKSIFSTAINLHNWISMQWDRINPEFEYLKTFRNKVDLENYIEETHSLELRSSLAIAQRYKKGLFPLYEKALNAYKFPKDANGNPIKNEPDQRIYLLTGHSSKGLEFDRVDLESDFPHLPTIYQNLKEKFTADDLINEANLYYVATTRAKFILKDTSKNDEMF